MTMDSRAALRAAQGNLVAAEAALQAARATTERARAMLTQVVRDGEGLDVRMRQASEALADKIKGQIASGASPTFASGDMAKAAGARAELDARRAAAERVVAEFATAEHEAEFGVEMAREAVASAVREVIKAEAEKLAESWEAVELKARSLRIRLGGDGDPISRLPGFSEKIGRAASFKIAWMISSASRRAKSRASRGPTSPTRFSATRTRRSTSATPIAGLRRLARSA